MRTQRAKKLCDLSTSNGPSSSRKTMEDQPQGAEDVADPVDRLGSSPRPRHVRLIRMPSRSLSPRLMLAAKKTEGIRSHSRAFPKMRMAGGIETGIRCHGAVRQDLDV